MTNKFSLLLLAAGLLIVYTNAAGQGSSSTIGQTGDRTISTPALFLNITPDARSGALGDAGVAISADANAVFWNPAKLAFNEKKFGVALSYNPWLRNLINDMSLSNLSGYYKLDDRQAFALSLNYFNLGNIQFTNDIGDPTGNFNPREFSFGGAYSRKLSENFGLAVGVKFIHSNLAGNIDFGSGGAVAQARAGNTAAGDIAVYYTKDLNISGRDVNLALGANLTNLGAKITYSDRSQREFVPTNLKLGTGITYNIDPYNKFTFALDFNKLLVPTPPIYETDEDGNYVTDSNGDLKIKDGRDPDRSFIGGPLLSFSDAPGGFKEEMQEISVSTGVEYWYNNLFAARAGYFSEHQNKGNRKYFTVGIGIRLQKVGFDFAYLIPRQQQNPLAETLRFTLHVTFGENEETEEIPASGD